MGSRQIGQPLPFSLSSRAQPKQQHMCAVSPCTMLASFGASIHTTHSFASAEDRA